MLGNSENNQNILNVAKYLETENYILDVDYDFFFDMEESISDAPWKKLSDDHSLEEFIGRYSDINFKQIIAHDEAIKLLVDNNVSNATCFHIDYHHDWYIDPYILDNASLGTIDGLITCANYGALAVKAGIIKNYVWVYPDNHNDISRIELPNSLALCGVEVSCIPYSIFKTEFEPYIKVEHIKLAIMCLSPDFVPQQEIQNFFEFFNCDQEFRYRALDYAYEYVLSGRKNLQKKYFRIGLSEKSITLFHGTPVKGLKKISSENGLVHVSPSSAFAASYGLTPDSKLGWIQGIDYISKESETVYLIPPEGKCIPKDYKTSLYLTVIKDIPVKSKGDCSNHDFILNNSLDVLKENNINDLSDYLNSCCVDLPNWEATIDMSPFINSGEVQDEFSEWMEMPWRALLLLRSTPFFLMLFIQLRTQKNCTIFFPLIFWQRWASRCLYPLVSEDFCKAEDDGYHGLSHGLEVGLLCVVYCQVLGIPPAPVFLSALCHDLERHENNNVSNASSSAKILRKLLDGPWQEYSGINDLRMLEAIREHPTISSEKDEMILVLRDADRARLAWERGFNSVFFSTEIGSEIALYGINFYADLEARLKFAENVILEALLSDSGVEIQVWHLGRRYELVKIKDWDPGILNFLIAHYNCSELIVFTEKTAKFERILTSKILDIPIRHARRLSDVLDCKFPKLEKLSRFIFVGYSEDFNTEESISKILNLPDDIIVHLEIGKENLPLVDQYLVQLAAKNIVLVYNLNPLIDEGLEFDSFIKMAVKAKKRNSELSSFRIITPFSWCWTSLPNEASLVLSSATNSYSPLTFRSGQSLSNDVFNETLSDVRLRRELCHECPFTINCLSIEYASQHGDIKSLPTNAKLFFNWNPYDEV